MLYKTFHKLYFFKKLNTFKDDKNGLFSKTWLKEDFDESEKSVDENNMLVLKKGDSLDSIKLLTVSIFISVNRVKSLKQYFENYNNI